MTINVFLEMGRVAACRESRDSDMRGQYSEKIGDGALANSAQRRCKSRNKAKVDENVTFVISDPFIYVITKRDGGALMWTRISTIVYPK